MMTQRMQAWLRQALAAAALLLTHHGAVPAQDNASFYGMHIHRADAGTAWPGAGIGAWRLWDANVRWPDIQPQRGQWEFAKLDRYVSMAALAKADVLLPLGMTPSWASARPSEKSSYRPGQASEPANMDDWRLYVRTVAQRYKGRVRHYDLWNEINDKGFYTGSVEKMVALTCEAYAILHAVDAANRLVSPSLIGAGSEPEQLEDFLRKGGRGCVDIVGYHFYVPHREPEEIVPLVQRVRAAMVRAGTGQLPLWNTESGWWMASLDGSDQDGADPRWRRVAVTEGAAIVARSLVLGRWAGLGRFYWYAWDNRILGLLEPSTGRAKPAGQAFFVIAGWMQNAVPVCTSSQAVWVCTLPELAGQARRIAWTTRPALHTYVLPTAERLVSVQRLDASMSTLGAGSATVTLGYEPVLVTSTLQ